MKKKLSLFLAMLLCLAFFSSCMGNGMYGYGNQQPAKERFFGTGETVITVSGANLEYVQEFIQSAQSRLSEKYPDVQVHFKGVDLNYDDMTSMDKEITKAFEDGTASDIVMTDYISIEKLAGQGYFYDLYEFLDNSDDISRDSYYPGMLKAWEHDGKLMQISPIVSYVVVMVNDKHIPLVENELTEYDSLSYKDMAEIFNIANESYEDKLPLYPAKTFYTRYLLEMERPVFFNEKTRLVSFEEKAGPLIDITEKISAGDMLLNEDKTKNLKDDQFLFYLGYTPSVSVLFPKSDAGMFTSGYYPYEDTDGNFNFNGSGTSFGINAKSENKELAWELLKEMTVDVNNLNGKAYKDFIPARKDEFLTKYKASLEDNLLNAKKTNISQEDIDSVIEMMNKHHEKLNICFPYNAYYSQIIMDESDKYISGKIDKETYITDIQTRLIELMKDS